MYCLCVGCVVLCLWDVLFVVYSVYFEAVCIWVLCFVSNALHVKLYGVCHLVYGVGILCVPDMYIVF